MKMTRVQGQRLRRRLPTMSLRTPVTGLTTEYQCSPRGALGSGDLHHAQIYDYLSQLGTARALAVWLIYVHGDHSDLLALKVDHDGIAWQLGVDGVRRNWAATKLFSCADYLNLQVDREAVAIGNSRAAEELNALTNARLRDLRTGRIADPGFNAVLHRAARLVSKVLGPLERALTRMFDTGWTPGRTTSVKSTERSSPEKYQARLDVSPGALPYARALVDSSGLWKEAALSTLGIHPDGPVTLLPRAFTCVDHNVLMTVPKNAKTDRVICYEPHVNIRLQRSVGVYMRDRLRLVTGIDLLDQSVNQSLARAGSVSGEFATLDLSMASDTLSLGLCQDLLPPEWFEFLDRLRSRRTLWPSGQITRNAKFASMGNGFTFELETLVFWALCEAVSLMPTTAYGDDIVVSTSDYASCVSALEQAGFRVNVDKSFSSGFFRESCGGDYYRGVDITPVYLDNYIEDVEKVVAFHNAVRLYAWREVEPHISWSRLLARARKRLDPLRSSFEHGVPLGPQGRGDGHFHVNCDEACPPRHPDGWDGWTYWSLLKVFTDRLVSDRASGDFHYTRLSSDILHRNSAAMLAAALGPKRPFVLYDMLRDSAWKECRRSQLFSHEWLNILWVS